MNEFGPGWNPGADEARKKALAAEETRRAALVAEQTAGDNSFDDLLNLTLGRNENSHELLRINANKAFGDIAEVMAVFELAQNCAKLPGINEAAKIEIRAVLQDYAAEMRQLAGYDEAKESEGAAPGSLRESMRHEAYKADRRIKKIIESLDQGPRL